MMEYIWILMLVVFLAGTATASTASYQFKYNCDFALHTLGKNDIAMVRFSGSKLPSSHCSIGFRGMRNATSVCVVSQPPFTLNVFGPTLILSQGNGQSNRKTYSSLSIISPSRYCTSGGRYLNIALDNANTGSSGSRTRGYFTLKVTAGPSSTPSDHVAIVVIAAPVAGGVVVIAMVIILLGIMRHRRMRMS